MSISDELYPSLRPLYFLSKAVGFVTFQLRPSKESSAILHRIICLTYLSFLLYLVTSSIIDIAQSFYYNNNLPKFERLVLFLQIVSVVLTNITTWYKLNLHYKKLIKMLYRISELGIQIELLGCIIPYRCFIKYQVCIIIPSIIGYASINFCQNTYMGENAPGILVLVIGNATVLAQFLCSLLLLRKYFELINGKLMKYGNFRKDGFLNDDDQKKNFKDLKIITSQNVKYFQPIKQISEIHRQLCNTCKDLNTFYSLPVLLSISHNIMNLTSICYFISAFTIDPPDSITTYLAVSLSTVFAIGLMSFIQLGTIAYVCSATRKEASFTGVLVHGLLNSNTHTSLKHDLILFSQQILHQRITFTAAGFFVLDFTLINAVIGAVTTYLVILIQFQMAT